MEVKVIDKSEVLPNIECLSVVEVKVNVCDIDASVVMYETVLGDFCVELYDVSTPETVDNFMNYVDDGDYDGSFMHRSMPGFIVQGGGFIWDDGVVDVATYF